MAEWLLLPEVQGLISKVTDALIRRVTNIWGIEDDRRKLENQLGYVRSLLADAERKAEAKTEAGRAVKLWMKNLKAVSYQAEDVLDHFRYEALRREAEGESGDTPRKVSYLSRDGLSVLGHKARFHHKASTDLNAVLTKINELVVEMNTFGLLEIPEAPQDVYRQTHSALDDSTEIFGRYYDREVVVELLLKKKEDQKHVQVLPIIGMGGLGKTTLAKMVYSDQRVQKHFQLRMWYCVSENFEPTAIVRSVIELATKERCDLPDNIELLQGRLREIIGRKRYLLILDDVWNEEQQKWEGCLKSLLCSSIGGSGSTIIVTSRSPQVASIMGTLPPHELACLSGDDSWELFSNKAFSKGVEMQAGFVTIGKCIVNKCKGLPLALKTMGGLMSSIHQVEEWEIIAGSNIGETISGKDEILPILKLSYRHLPPEMKRCFAYCAAFPKDLVMDKDKLIELWLANGFIQEEGTIELLAQRAEFVFNELAWRSFLEDVKVRRFYDHTGYEAVGCKMHDLMHDLAKHVNDECAFAAELNQRKVSIQDVRHLKLMSYQLEKISGLLKEASSLRTLLIKDDHAYIKELKLVSLRALRCKDPSIIHGQLTNAVHLRYLDLSGSNIAELPGQVSILYNLLSLRLNGCRNLQYLPEGMTSLRKLTYLYLLGCRQLKRMPPKLSLLKNLRILTTFIVGTEDDCGIEELRGIGKHGYRLELYNLRNVKSGSKTDLHERKNLSELVLYWGLIEAESTSDEASNAEQVLESLAPHDELKTLEVHGYGGVAIPQWMIDPRMFRCLKKLHMSSCSRCKELPKVWLSSSLEELCLSEMRSLTTLCKNIDSEPAGCNTPLQIFPKLNKMALEDLPELERWAENSAGEPIRSVMFPLLKTLCIYGCGKLTSLPKCPVLTRLKGQTEVMSLDDHPSKRQRSLTSDDGYKSISNCFPFLEVLEFIRCSRPVEELQCLPRLRSLSFRDCKLEGKSFNGFLALTQLERLEISFCSSLQEIPMLPVSLEEMVILSCRSLVALPSNLGNLAKLRYLSVKRCDGLRTLPDGMDGLTSLERLEIWLCPGINKFPQGLLQRLPTLETLMMYGCPDLQRRCREGGEYFDLVSCIPTIDIPAEEAETE